MSARPLIDPDVLTQAARPMPVVVIFDWSYSMRFVQQDIAAALRALPGEFEGRTVLRNSGEIALITMSHEGVVLRTGEPDVPPFGFVRAPAFTPPDDVVCDGTTQLDRALQLAVDLLERRCRQCAEAGRATYRPYIAIISDGDPTDEDGASDDTRWRRPAQRVRETLDGKVLVEAFVPAGSPCGILAELVGGDDLVHELDPAKLAQVLEAVSFSAERGATTHPRSATDVVRDDIARGHDDATGGGQP